MSTPNKGGVDRHPGTTADIAPRWQFAECFAGGGIAVALFVLVLPVLVDLTQSLGLLSTTGLLSGFLVLWVFCWSLLGTVRGQVLE